MNSKQINFFIMPEDLLEIELFLINEGILFIPQPIYNEKNIYSPSIIRDPKPKIDFGKVYLTQYQFSNEILIEKVEMQEYSILDVEKSLAIQFNIGGFLYKPNQLERGRFYYTLGYYNENKSFIKKDEYFIKWADKVCKEFKKRFLKKGNTFIYYSQKATDWIKETGAHEDPLGLRIINQIV